MSTQLYLNDTYLFGCATNIVGRGVDDKGTYVLFRETVFYPQGGGQPSDQGVMETSGGLIPINFVRQADHEIRHYVAVADDSSLEKLIKEEVRIKIDSSRRLLNARYHTAAHLLGNVVESMHADLKAVKGHSFPGEAYVEFIGEATPDTALLETNITLISKQRLMISIFEILPYEFENKYYKLPYPVPDHKAFRAMQIGGLTPVPCGGTHINNITEIGKIGIRKISRKTGRLKISYLIMDGEC